MDGVTSDSNKRKDRKKDSESAKVQMTVNSDEKVYVSENTTYGDAVKEPPVSEEEREDEQFCG